MDTIQEPVDPLRKEKKKKKEETSLERLRVALEKLQLARVKITFTLIAVGFTAYKIFYSRMEAGKEPLLDFPNGRHIGLFLILVGFIVLSLATAQHRKSLAQLKLQYPSMHYSVSLIMSYILLALSFTLFIVIAARL